MNRAAYNLAILWGCLFTFNSLGSCILVGLSNATWSQLAAQSKFLICVGIWVNWSGVMMAYFSKAISNIELGRHIPTSTGDTKFVTKSQSQGLSTIAKIMIALTALGWAVILSPAIFR